MWGVVILQPCWLLHTFWWETIKSKVKGPYEWCRSHTFTLTSFAPSCISNSFLPFLSFPNVHVLSNSLKRPSLPIPTLLTLDTSCNCSLCKACFTQCPPVLKQSSDNRTSLIWTKKRKKILGTAASRGHLCGLSSLFSQQFGFVFQG